MTAHFIIQDFPTQTVSAISIPGYGSARAMNLGGQYVHMFSPTLLNEFRAGYYRKVTWTTGPRTNTNFTPSQLGIVGLSKGGPGTGKLTGNQAGFPILSISGYQSISDWAAGQATRAVLSSSWIT